MARSWSGADRVFLILAIIPQIIAFCLLLGVLQAGWGYGYGNEPKTYITLIDATGVVSNNISKGLPDTRDSSHFKDFFAIYPLAYCSGSKDNTTGQFTINHCSKPITQTFDQQYEWKGLGVDISSRYGDIDSVPRLIPIFSLVAFIASALCVIPGVLSYLWSVLSILSAFISGVTTLAAMALIVITGGFGQGLYQHVNDYRATDTALIETVGGQRIFVFLWGAAVMSSLATVFWIFAALERRRNGRPLPSNRLGRMGEAKSGRMQDSLVSVPRPLRLLTRRTTDLFAGALKQKKGAKRPAYFELDDNDQQPFFLADSYYPSRRALGDTARSESERSFQAHWPPRRECYDGFREKNMHG